MPRSHENASGSASGRVGRGMAEMAEKRSMRYGVPAAVVDPLLAILFDLHALQEQVLTTLKSVGVDISSLPQRYACSSSSHEAAACPTTSSTQDAAQPINTEKPAEAFGHPLDMYCLCSGASSGCDERAAAVEAVLAWADIVDVKVPDVPEVDLLKGEAGRHMAALFIASDVKGDGRPCIVDEAVSMPAVKLRKQERAVRWVGTALDGIAATTSKVCVGSFTLSELQQQADAWARYERVLGDACRSMRDLLLSICTTSTSQSLSCHAKWIEDTRVQPAASPEGTKTPSQPTVEVPACAAMRECHEGLILSNDALATCLYNVHEAHLALADAVETYTAEATVVCQRERQYWQGVKTLQDEYHAFKWIRHRISRLRSGIEAYCKQLD